MRTKIYYLALFTTIFTLSMTIVSAESEVYRWVDDDGVVHFENRAPRQADAEIITIKSDRSRDSQASIDTPSQDTAPAVDTEASTEASYAQQRRDERAIKRQEAAKKEKLTAAMCENSRTVVARLEPMNRVLVEQEDGALERMDDDDRLQRLDEAKAYIAKNCGK